jgi:hypothetical protein
MTTEVAAPAKVAMIVERYIQMRDRKAELKAAYDASVKDIDVGMERIERHLLNELNAMGATSMSTPFGTPYINLRTSATVADWPATLAFIQGNNAWEMLERRVNKTAVEAFRTEHEDLPPGINWREERVVNIRRN